jgi:tetratricopeptide (TPR) repeat protein
MGIGGHDGAAPEKGEPVIRTWRIGLPAAVVLVLVALAGVLHAATVVHAATSQADKDLQKGKEAYLAKDFASAEKYFRAVVQDAPDLAFAHLYLGHSLFYQDKFKEAIPEYERARELSTKGREMTTSSGEMSQADERLLTDQLGMAYGLAGRLDDARTLYEEAIRKDPHYAMYYYNLACTDGEQGRLDDAITHLKQGYKLKQHMLPWEKFPDPRHDDSFKKLLNDPKFEAALKEMGF